MTPQERLRKHQRALEKTQRELDRERVKLENQEKKLVQDIKKSAKNGQMGACKIQAKDLVRTRRYVIHYRLHGSILPPLIKCTCVGLFRCSGVCMISRPRRLDVSYATPVIDTLFLLFLQIYSKILLHANPTPSHLAPNPNRSFQRTNDAINERRHFAAWQHESADESPCTAAHRHGI